jgi:hypothetical protein
MNAAIFWWILFAAYLAVLYVFYKVLMFVFKRAVTKRQISPNVLNGIRFFIRLGIIIVAFSTFIGISGDLVPGGIPAEIAILVSTAVGTVIALSTTTVIQNFVAGIYILITKPFAIGNLIRITSSYEGIVEEISLNHTKIRLRSGSLILVSNQAILSSKIVNFTLPVEEHEGTVKIKKLADEFRSGLADQGLTKYVFTIDLPKEKPERTRAAFVEVAEQFKDVFKEPPRFITTAYTGMVTVSIILVADDPEIIMKNKEGVVEALYKHIFK